MAVDEEAMSVDIPKTLELCADERPDYIFIDRSEGLVFEDFSALGAVEGTTSIFDASQYLTNVICGDHPNPFEWGFDLMLASIHKNFPGPQKAMLGSGAPTSAGGQSSRASRRSSPICMSPAPTPQG